MSATFNFLDTSDAKIQEIWLRYLKLRGLSSEQDPIPRGESPEEFRRKWEKYLYSQAPCGAAVPGTSATPAGGVIADVATKVEAGELATDVPEEDALKSGAVLFYEHKDFGGKVWALPKGNYAWVEDAGIPNDQVSSVKVPKGIKLRIFEHKDYAGKAREVSGNISYLGDDWNDKMSSCKVY